APHCCVCLHVLRLYRLAFSVLVSDLSGGSTGLLSEQHGDSRHFLARWSLRGSRRRRDSRRLVSASRSECAVRPCSPRRYWLDALLTVPPRGCPCAFSPYLRCLPGYLLFVIRERPRRLLYRPD